jgi:hypothetical protein
MYILLLKQQVSALEDKLDVTNGSYIEVMRLKNKLSDSSVLTQKEWRDASDKIALLTEGTTEHAAASISLNEIAARRRDVRAHLDKTVARVEDTSREVERLKEELSAKQADLSRAVAGGATGHLASVSPIPAAAKAASFLTARLKSRSQTNLAKLEGYDSSTPPRLLVSNPDSL